MNADQEINNEQEQWSGSDPETKPNQPDKPSQASAGSDLDTGDVQTQPSTRSDPGTSSDQFSAPQKDDSPQAAVIENPRPSDKMASHNMPTSPVSVNKSERTWFAQADVDELRSRWTSIQIQFVDEPCAAVEQGETLVAETAERVKQMISDLQQSIGQQWLNHDDISTEELRTILLSYRELLDRLLKQ